MALAPEAREELEALCLDLVRIESVSGNEERVAAFAAAWLEERGLEVTVVERTVVARLGSGEGPRLLLNSHLDTVPAGEGWEADPWDVAWEGERLTGLGANDAKCCAASMMWAAAELARGAGGAPLPGELVLALNQQEETTNRGMELVLEHLGGPPDLAVTGEPTGLEVVRAQAGLAVLEARWRGRACHAAHVARVEHENALLLAARELAGVPPVWTLDPPHPLLGASTLATTVLHAGKRHNLVPDLAEAVFDARLAAPHDADGCVARLAELLPSAELSVRSRRLGPVETAAEHPLVRVALGAAGREAAVGSSTLSDMALLPGVPAVKCGPGRTERSHTPNEFVTREELAAGGAFYAAVVPAALAAAQTESAR